MDRETISKKRREIYCLILRYKEKPNDKDYSQLQKIYDNLLRKETRLEYSIKEEKEEKSVIEEAIQSLSTKNNTDETITTEELISIKENMEVLELKKEIVDSCIFLDTQELENIQWLKDIAIEGLKLKDKNFNKCFQEKLNNQTF